MSTSAFLMTLSWLFFIYSSIKLYIKITDDIKGVEKTVNDLKKEILSKKDI